MFKRSKKKKTNISELTSQDAIEERELIEHHCENSGHKEVKQESIVFFYTNDEFLDTFDDDDIFDRIYTKYSKLRDIDKGNLSDKDVREEIIRLFNDVDFIRDNMTFFDITYDVFVRTFLSRYMEYFSGVFIRKIRDVMKKNKRFLDSKR